MTWLKLDDGFHRHEKVAPLSDRAWRLHVTVMLECSAKLTDGRLPINLLDTLPRAPRGRTLQTTVRELESAGLWEIDADSVLVHDFLDWNPSKQEVLDLRAKRQAAGRAGGKQRASNEQAKPKQVLEQESSKTEAKSNPVPVPVPFASEEAKDLSSTSSPQSAKADEQRAIVRRVFEHWKLDTGHHKAKLDPKRKRRIEARLREGLTEEDLLDAIEGRHKNAWLMGSNPDGQVYDKIETIFRDCEQVEKLRDLKRGRAAPASLSDQQSINLEGVTVE